MDARFPDSPRPGGTDAVRHESNRLSRQWAAVQDAAAAVAMLAGLEPEKASLNIRNFPALIKDADGWRLELAKNHISDIAAMMQPGLSALLATNARGQDASAPAMTLWREYYAAREAIVALLPEQGSMGPRRSA